MAGAFFYNHQRRVLPTIGHNARSPCRGYGPGTPASRGSVRHTWSKLPAAFWYPLRQRAACKRYTTSAGEGRSPHPRQQAPLCLVVRRSSYNVTECNIILHCINTLQSVTPLYVFIKRYTLYHVLSMGHKVLTFPYRLHIR